MTYQTNKEKHKRRVEVVVSIIFFIGIIFCFAGYLFYYEGIEFLQALKQVSIMVLYFIIIFLLGLLLIFACLFIGRLIRKARIKKEDDLR